MEKPPKNVVSSDQWLIQKMRQIQVQVFELCSRCGTINTWGGSGFIWMLFLIEPSGNFLGELGFLRIDPFIMFGGLIPMFICFESVIEFLLGFESIVRCGLKRDFGFASLLSFCGLLGFSLFSKIISLFWSGPSIFEGPPS